MGKQQSIAALKRSLTQWTKLKFTFVIAGVFAAILVAIIVVSTMVAAVTAPLAAVQQPIEWLFGHSDEDPDPEATQTLSDCLVYKPADLEPALRQISSGTDPAVAQGWIMYSLAHTETSSAQTSSAPPRGGSSPTSTTMPRRDTANPSYETLTAFSQAWRTATPAGNTPTSTPSASVSSGSDEATEEGTQPPPVPAQLSAIDPATTYTGYAVAGLVGTLELDNRGVIELDEDHQNELAQSLAGACLDESQ